MKEIAAGRGAARVPVCLSFSSVQVAVAAVL